MPIPDERRIRKTQLWERDDRLNELIQRKAEETRRLSDAVAVDLNKQMEDFENYVHSLKKEYQLKFEENLLEGIQHLEDTVKKQTGDLMNSVEEQNEYINKIFQEFRKESDNKISKDVADRLDRFNDQSTELRKWWEDYKKIFSDQMSKYQADTYKRYDELQKKMVDLEKRLARLEGQR